MLKFKRKFWRQSVNGALDIQQKFYIRKIPINSRKSLELLDLSIIKIDGRDVFPEPGVTPNLMTLQNIPLLMHV